MSRQQRGGGRGDVAKGAGYAAFLGAGLIGVAVIIGIVLLQIGDQDNVGPSGAATPPKSTSTSTTKPKSSTTATSTSTGITTPARPPNQVHLIVLNGGAPSGEAARTASQLELKGYTNQDKANTWSGHDQSGNTVYCRAGFDREGAALATGVTGAKLTIPYPDPAPPNTEGTDCVVVVGS
jgi:hypothetical protein